MIGIYGGTFDPVHYGHLRTAMEVKEIFSLRQMRLIPCSQPVLRKTAVTAAEIRIEMLQLAVQNQPDLIIDRRELDRKGFSYTIDTLKSIRAETPHSSLLLFIGTDAFKGLSKWQQWEQLFDYAHIVVITRPSYKQQDLTAFFSDKLSKNREDLKRKNSGYLFFQSVSQLDISATAIRNIISTGLRPDFLLPDNIIEYIKQNKLYKLS